MRCRCTASTGGTRASTYLVAWDGPAPVGHVHIAWEKTRLELRSSRTCTYSPSDAATAWGSFSRMFGRAGVLASHYRCSLSVSEANSDARRLYERLGYTRASVPPERVRGTITIRGGIASTWTTRCCISRSALADDPNAPDPVGWRAASPKPTPSGHCGSAGAGLPSFSRGGRGEDPRPNAAPA